MLENSNQAGTHRGVITCEYVVMTIFINHTSFCIKKFLLLVSYFCEKYTLALTMSSIYLCELFILFFYCIFLFHPLRGFYVYLVVDPQIAICGYNRTPLRG